MIAYNRPVLIDNRRFREEDPGIKAHFDAVEKESEAFPKENGLIVDKKLVIFVDCPTCGSKEHDQLFIKYGFIHVQCRRCSHVFVKNRLLEEALLEIYSKSEADKLSSARKANHAGLSKYWNMIYEKYIGYLRTLNIQNKNLLDIGCGAGHFLSFCKDRTDFKLHGMDFCEHAHEFLSDLIGTDNFYFKKRVEDTDFNKKFGMITLWGVFEHVCDPKSLLEKCKELISKDGRIIILVPNFFSRAFSILGVSTPTLNPRAHINFYTGKSMEYVCKNTGFVIENLFQELPVIDLMHKYIDCDNELIESILRKNESYYHVYILKRRSA